MPTQKEILDSFVVKNYRVGDEFSIGEVYERLEKDFERQYPHNQHVRSTLRDLLQQLREEERLIFEGGRGEKEAGKYKRAH